MTWWRLLAAWAVAGLAGCLLAGAQRGRRSKRTAEALAGVSGWCVARARGMLPAAMTDDEAPRYFFKSETWRARWQKK